MEQLIGGPVGELRCVYKEALLLSVAAILPSFLLMCWTDWSALTSTPAVIVAVGMGGLLWTTILWRRQHPIAVEVAGLLRRKR